MVVRVVWTLLFIEMEQPFPCVTIRMSQVARVSIWRPKRVRVCASGRGRWEAWGRLGKCDDVDFFVCLWLLSLQRLLPAVPCTSVVVCAISGNRISDLVRHALSVNGPMERSFAGAEKHMRVP